MKPLAIIPTYLSNPSHVPVLRDCLRTMRATSDCDVLIVDDESPLQGSLPLLKRIAKEYDAEYVRRSENGGFSRTVNVGLKIARAEKRTGILVNMDISFIKPGWLEAGMNDPADVVGGRLLYPNLLIQHGGVYFSLLHQYFDHLFKFAPANLPEANQRWEVPVTGALQFIKPTALERIGLYDEDYRLSYEDVDYCLRTCFSGLTCAMNPQVVALHHEGLVRMKAQTPKMAQWIAHSHALLAHKFQHASFTRFVHPLDRKDAHVHSISGGTTATDPSEERESGNSPALASEADSPEV